MNKDNKELDDNISFTNMDVEGISKKYDLTKRDNTKIEVSKAEAKAISSGIIKAMIVPVICVFLGFGLTILLMYLWLFI